jgi:hypothetical protein
MYKLAIMAEYEGLTEPGRERVRCCGGKGYLAGELAKSQAVVEIMENREGLLEALATNIICWRRSARKMTANCDPGKLFPLLTVNLFS